MANALIIFLYVAILMYGTTIAGSVVEEKSANTLEVLLSSTKAPLVLWGKMLGIAALGFCQIAAIFAGVTLASAIAAQRHFEHSSQPAFGQTSLEGLALVALFFGLGYFSYAAMFAAFGSAVPDGERMRQYTALLYIPLYIAFFVALAGNNGTLEHARILSMLPLVSPLIMFARILGGTAPIIDIVTAIVSSIGFVMLLSQIATRLYTAQALLKLTRDPLGKP